MPFFTAERRIERKMTAIMDHNSGVEYWYKDITDYIGSLYFAVRTRGEEFLRLLGTLSW